jgi:hypothetical protein
MRRFGKSKSKKKTSDSMKEKIEIMKVEWKKYEAKIMEARARGKRCRTSGLRTENREYKPPAPGTARWNDMLKRIAKAKKAELEEAAKARGETIPEGGSGP